MDFCPDIPDIPGQSSDFPNLTRALQAEVKLEHEHQHPDCHKHHEGHHKHHGGRHGHHGVRHGHHGGPHKHRHCHGHRHDHERSHSPKRCHHHGLTSCHVRDYEHTPPPEYTEGTNDDPPSIHFKPESKSMETKNDKLNHELDTEKGPSKWTPPPFIEDPKAPKDTGKFVLIVIGLFGLVHHLPFTFLFTATEYWMYKFRDPASNSTDPNDRSWLQANYSAFHRITLVVPGLICNLIAALVGHKIRAQTRLFSVLVVHSCVLIVNAIMTQIDTDNWQMGFFIFTLATQTFMACCSSLGGSGSMGLISKLPPRYMNAQLMGQGGAAVFSGVLRLISVLVTPSVVGAALMYFVTGSALMIIMMVLLYIATKSKFFMYYTHKSTIEEKKQKMRDIKDFKLIVKLTWPIMLINLFPMFMPLDSVANLVASEYAKDKSSAWAQRFFLPTCAYLGPAITGLLGRTLYNILNFDCSLVTLGVVVFVKDVVFGLMVFFSNAYPRHHTPVIFNHDWEYGLIRATSSFIGDFIMNVNMIKSMNMVPRNRIEMSMMVHMCIFSLVATATAPFNVLVVSML